MSIFSPFYAHACFVTIAFIWTEVALDLAVSASLTTSYTGRPCPGEDVTLTCTVTGSRLTWESDVISDVHYIRGFVMVDSTNEQDGVTATVTNITNGTITSTLMITGTFWLNNEGSMISCRGVGSVIAQSAGSPSPPVTIRHSVLSSSAEGASVSVQWDPPTDNGGRDDLTYTVTISPPAQLSATVVTSTSVTVFAVDYNEDYTVSVVAQSCVNGTSMAGKYTFSVDPPLVLCALPSPPDKGSIVNVTTLPSFLVKGMVIYYRCAQDLYPSEDQPSTCGSDGMWSPDPGRIVCTTETCASMPSIIATAVGVTLAVSAFVFTILGFLAGVLVTCLITHKKAVHSTAKNQANLQLTLPAGSVYEDVSPPSKKEIELKSNQAYGPVGGH